jgi:solute carrier family 25 (mitochondrial uncoupling protein), member 8/9
MIAGLVTTTITNPIDVVKTRMFVGGARYPSATACARDVLRKDGVAGFMRVRDRWRPVNAFRMVTLLAE